MEFLFYFVEICMQVGFFASKVISVSALLFGTLEYPCFDKIKARYALFWHSHVKNFQPIIKHPLF